MLQATQQLRDVVTRFGVQYDVGDVDLAKLALGVFYLSHTIHLTKIWDPSSTLGSG